MQLFYAPASPFVRKVLMVLHETDQIDEVELTTVSGTAIASGTIPLDQNPLGKIPVLARDDGPAIYDSRVICRYLNQRAKADFYPQDQSQWDILTLEATADGIMEASLAIVYEARVRPDQFQYPVWVEAQWEKARRAIENLEHQWIAHLNGPLTIGQIATACALGYCDFRLPKRDWRSQNPALAAWFATFSKRDSFQATIPKP